MSFEQYGLTAGSIDVRLRLFTLSLKCEHVNCQRAIFAPTAMFTHDEFREPTSLNKKTLCIGQAAIRKGLQGWDAFTDSELADHDCISCGSNFE